ncbi:hypothetical protein CP983_35010 [Streptomyces chartreusis]|nr:hypothetical protein CP983_35010 [Streptomyces chartreusis]
MGSAAGIGRRRNVISAAVSAGAPVRRGVEGRSAGRGGVPPEAAGPAFPELREAPVAGCRPEFSAPGDMPVDGRRPRLSEFGDTPAAGPRAVFSVFGVAPGPGRPASGGVSGKRAEARGGGGAVPEPGDGMRALGEVGVREPVGSGARPSPLGSGLTSTPPGTDPSVRVSSPPSLS